MKEMFTTPTDPTPIRPTIASCYGPVERYRRAMERAGCSPDEAAVRVGPIDAFLMYWVAAFMPEPPNVVDLLADATAGASTAHWVAHPLVRSVRAPRHDKPAPGAVRWRAFFGDAAASAVPSHPGQRVDLTGSEPDLSRHEPKAVTGGHVNGNGGPPTVGRGAPVLYPVGPAGAGEDPAETVRRIFARDAAALVLFMPIGRTGGDGPIAALLRATGPGTGLRLAALREVSPFLASSELALIHPDGDPVAADVLERVEQMYAGNFRYIDLVRAAVEAATGPAEGPAVTAAGGEGLGTANQREQEYGTAVGRIRQAVEEATPEGATVLVVSRGDDQLLALAGRRGRHFPQTPEGQYAGHHPPDSAAAVAHLESLREAGAQYLLFPNTAGWWLEHYADFRRHLEARYAVAVCRPETCVLFDLARAAGGSRVERPRVLPYPELVGAIRKVVQQVLPADAAIVVVSKGDSQLLDLGGRRTWHFPQTADGVYTGYHPADAEACVAGLEALRRRGADHFLLPAPYRWWLDHYAPLARHLDEAGERILDDERCVIYRFRGRRPNLLGRVAGLLPAMPRRAVAVDSSAGSGQGETAAGNPTSEGQGR